AALAAGAGLAADRPWSAPAGPALEAALIQGNFSQDEKWDPAFRGAIRERYARLTLEHTGADLIVWPETAIPQLYHRIAPGYLAPLAERVRRAGGALVLGVPYREPGGSGEGPLHNSVAVLGPERAFYHKRRLVPFGEYVPFRDLLGRSLDFLGAPMADYTPGGPGRPVPVGDGLRLGVSICYEAAYPRVAAQSAAGADLLVNVSNDAWFGASLAPHQHLQMARQRAAEARRWLVRATNTGITAVIDPRGRVAASAAAFETAVVTERVEPRRGTTPYVALGDGPLLALLALALAGARLEPLRRRAAARAAARTAR
ncbi:apolipoprotein N-acyltransferase, partial [Halorhodospira neutriphila]